MNAAFQGTSTYDDIVDKTVSSGQEDWGKIMEVCDRVAADKEKGAKDALKALVRNINNPNPNVAAVSVVLLKAVFNNGGKAFQVECAQQPLMDEIHRLLQTKTNAPSKVCSEIKAMLQDWVLDHGANAQLARIYSTYNRLKSEGHSFPKTDRPFPEPPLPANASAADIAAKEEADLARAIAESLKEAEKSKAPTQASSLYPTGNTPVAAAPQKAEPAKAASSKHVRALYTFEVQEEGELGIVAGDIATLLDDSHPDWWKAELNGKVGLIPSNYVEVIREDPVALVVAARAQDKAIDPALIDRLLDKLLTAQATPTDTSFNAEIEQLYERVVGEMKPKVQAKLDALTNKELALSQLSEQFHGTKALYLRLAKDGELALQGQTGMASPAGYGAPMQGGGYYQPQAYGQQYGQPGGAQGGYGYQ
eukprot:comp22016_c0_seq1/m.31886 comp22016_c0_seq1/g.31886  ORF comp22016_c0_seq1/g.31886 comp22016_c0_seq1/m.31886 type:complete len:421 (-) comp22016_c0_seq1:159-1421(-)